MLERSYISVPPAVAPRAPNVTVITQTTSCTFILEEILQDTGSVRDSSKSIFFDDQAVDFLHAKGERIEWDNFAANFTKEITARLLVEAANEIMVSSEPATENRHRRNGLRWQAARHECRRTFPAGDLTAEILTRSVMREGKGWAPKQVESCLETTETEEE